MGSLTILLVCLSLFAGGICVSANQSINNQQLVNLLLELLKNHPQQQINHAAPVYRKLSYSNTPSSTYSAAVPALSDPAPATYSAPAPPTYGAAAPVVSAPAPVQPTYGAAAPVALASAPAQSTYTAAAPAQRQAVVAPTYGASNQITLDVTPTDPCTPSPCLNEGVCTVSGNAAVCACPWGWTGSRCEKCLTDCASNPCSGNKQCKAKFGGGYDCVCPIDRKGPNCEYANDACDVNRCQNGGSCKLEVGGGYSCVCVQPFDGPSCERAWQNPCTDETLRSNDLVQFPNPWNRNSYLVCYDVQKFHEMPCPAGTYFNSKLNHCVPEGYDPPVCPDNYCLNGGECLIDDQNALKCACKRGFSGDQCEVNIDECAYGGNEACGTGGYCVDQINGYYCQCQNGGIGLDCQSTMTNPCTADNVAAENNYFDFPSQNGDAYLHCTGVGQFSVRRCPDSLFWSQDEQTCVLERPLRRLSTGPCGNSPCKNGGTCSELSAGTFSCTCKVGYTGDVCEQIIDYCASNPCQNGGRCLGYAGGYTCVCPDKVIDECCCNGVTNPCPPKAKLVPGINNYFEHLFPHRYIHCDFEGRAFVRNCAPGLRWYQDALACLSDQHVKTFLASQQYNAGPSYGTVAPVVDTTPVKQSSAPVNYGSPAPVVKAAVQPTYGAAAPVVSAPAPVQPTYGATAPVVSAPAPAQPTYGAAAPVVSAPAPAPVQPTYGSAAPIVSAPAPAQPTYGAAAPVVSAPAPVQPTYGAAAPVVSAPAPAPAQPTYGGAAPAVDSQPVLSNAAPTYGSAAPIVSAPAPAQPTYGAAAPIVSAPAPAQPTYGAAAPVVASAPAQPTYGSAAPVTVSAPAQPTYGSAAPVVASAPSQPTYGSAAPAVSVQQTTYNANAPILNSAAPNNAYGSLSAQATAVKAQATYGVPPQLTVSQTPSFGSATPAFKQVSSSTSYGSSSSQSQSSQSNNFQSSQTTTYGAAPVSPNSSNNNNLQSSILAIAQQLNMTPQQVMQMFQASPTTQSSVDASGQTDQAQMLSNNYKRKYGKRL